MGSGESHHEGEVPFADYAHPHPSQSQQQQDAFYGEQQAAYAYMQQNYSQQEQQQQAHDQEQEAHEENYAANYAEAYANVQPAPEQGVWIDPAATAQLASGGIEAPQVAVDTATGAPAQPAIAEAYQTTVAIQPSAPQELGGTAAGTPAQPVIAEAYQTTLAIQPSAPQELGGGAGDAQLICTPCQTTAATDKAEPQTQPPATDTLPDTNPEISPQHEPILIASTLGPGKVLQEEAQAAFQRLRREKERELSNIQSEYSKRLRDAEREFAKITKIQEHEYRAAIEETSRLFIEPPAMVCEADREKVRSCYKRSGKATLHCFRAVQDFFNCVSAERGLVVKRSKTNNVVTS